MDASELAIRSRALPGRFADRLSAKTSQQVKDLADVGEWDEEIDLLLAGLHKNDATITTAERDEIKVLLDAMNEPTDRLNALRVAG